MGLTLRARRGLALAVVVLLVVAGSTVGHLASVTRIALGAAAEEGALLARQLYHQSSRVLAAAPVPSPAVLQRDPGIHAMLEGIIGYSHTVVYAAVVDPSGRILAHSNPQRVGEILPPRQSLEHMKEWSILRSVLSLLGEPDVYEAQVPMVLGDRPFATVRVGVSTSLLRQELARAALHSLMVALVALGVAVVVGLGVGHMLLRALQRIRQGMERLARGEQRAAADLTRDDELGELVARVGRLGERTRREGTIDKLEDAVIVLNANREVVFHNQAAEALLGRRPETVLPTAHPLATVVAELFDHGIHHRNAPVDVPVADGQSRELAVSSDRIAEGDRKGGGVLSLRNMEPVRAVQSLVTYSQKLAALGRLTSGVAHEVKNPLNAMRIHLELAKTRLASVNQPGVRDNLDVIAQEIQRLDRVVQGFMNFMRPQELNITPVGVESFLADVARLMEPEAGRAGTKIVLDVAPDLPLVAGDAQLLQQACTNLVTNAIQAMPGGGTVTLVAGAGPAGTIEVRVKDDGVGIAPEDLDRIFRLYYTTKPGGSGIGLSMVYRIVQLHDGRIDVESEVGRGTTVVLTLPVASP